MSVLSLPRLKTLLDRLTSARAGYLDNLASYTSAKAAFIDAAITSRASSTEVTKSSVWTSSKAAFLNRDINPSPGAQIHNGAPVPHPDAEPSTLIDVTADLQTRTFGSLLNPGATYANIASPSGKGAITLLVLVITQQTGSSTGCEFQVTIDGDIIYTSAARNMAVGEQCYFVVFGAYEYDKTAGQCRVMGFEYIPFNTQILIAARNATSTGNCYMQAYGAGRYFAT